MAHNVSFALHNVHLAPRTQTAYHAIIQLNGVLFPVHVYVMHSYLRHQIRLYVNHAIIHVGPAHHIHTVRIAHHIHIDIYQPNNANA